MLAIRIEPADGVIAAIARREIGVGAFHAGVEAADHNADARVSGTERPHVGRADHVDVPGVFHGGLRDRGGPRPRRRDRRVEPHFTHVAARSEAADGLLGRGHRESVEHPEWLHLAHRAVRLLACELRLDRRLRVVRDTAQCVDHRVRARAARQPRGVESGGACIGLGGEHHDHGYLRVGRQRREAGFEIGVHSAGVREARREKENACEKRRDCTHDVPPFPGDPLGGSPFNACAPKSLYLDSARAAWTGGRGVSMP